MTYRGGCLCGAVRYEAAGPATSPCFCHCTSCRRAAGAPGVPWVTFQRAVFRLTRGEPREHRSSEQVLRGFCATCGTSLTYRHEAKPDELDVALATLDDLEAVRPEAHLWVEDKPTWVSVRDGLPQFPRGREGAETRGRGVRPGYGAVSARIVVEDAGGLVQFLRHVFGACGDHAPGTPTELRIGDSTILISEPGPRSTSLAFLYVYVPDVAAAHRRALEGGARQLEAPRETPYGDRRSMIEDPWGNTWQIASYAGDHGVSSAPPISKLMVNT